MLISQHWQINQSIYQNAQRAKEDANGVKDLMQKMLCSRDECAGKSALTRSSAFSQSGTTPHGEKI
jgi:hypothetical protein